MSVRLHRPFTVSENHDQLLSTLMPVTLAALVVITIVISIVSLIVKKNSKNNAQVRILHVKLRVMRELPVLTQIAGGNNSKTGIPENEN